MHTRRDRSSRPRTGSRRPLLGNASPSESNFTGAVDAVLSVLRRDGSLLPDMGTPEAAGKLLAGLVELALSLAAQAAGTADIEALDQLLVELRDNGVDVDLVPAGGA